MVCHDGSEESCSAFKTVFDGLMKKGDSLTVVNCWSDKKEAYLKLEYKNNYIKEICDATCIVLGDKYLFHSVKMADDDKVSTKEHLENAAKELKADFMVVGYHGRGRKGCGDDPSIMGSGAQYLAIG